MLFWDTSKCILIACLVVDRCCVKKLIFVKKKKRFLCRHINWKIIYWTIYMKQKKYRIYTHIINIQFHFKYTHTDWKSILLENSYIYEENSLVAEELLTYFSPFLVVSRNERSEIVHKLVKENLRNSNLWIILTLAHSYPPIEIVYKSKISISSSEHWRSQVDINFPSNAYWN